MILNINATTRFKKDLKLIIRRGYNIDLLDRVVSKLAEGKVLEERYCDHQLTGNYAGFRECHITPDWLLIYKVNSHELILILSRTGTHSDLL